MRSPARLILALTIAIIILGVINAVLFEALVLTFSLYASAQFVTLGAALLVLAAGFIGATVLGSYFYNVFTRVLYSALAIWMGSFAYLFFAAALLGIVAGVASLFSASFPSTQVGSVFFVLAILVSIYGVLHARKITVARYSVALPNLPVAWKNKKAVWISDLHLGQLHGSAFAGRVGKAVQKLAPDIIFIGGDLFDGTRAPDLNDLARPLASLSAPWGVFYITGNHEEFGDASAFLRVVRTLGMRVLADEAVTIEGVQIVGVDYHNANTTEGFKDILSKLQLNAAQPSILLKHEPNNLAVAEAAGISLQISGHTHKGQQWPFGYLAQLSYKGFAYGLKAHGALKVLVSSGAGTWGPPLRVGTNSEVVEITFV